MSALAELFKHHLKQRLAYRETFLFSLLLHPLVMLLIALIFRAIYAHRQQSQLVGYSLGQMVWYFGASQFFYYLVWNVVEKNMSERVVLGTMEQQLVRPYSLFVWELVQLAAHKVLALLFELAPVFLLYVLIFPPDFLTLAGVVRYSLLTTLAALQFFAISFALGVVSFTWHDVSSLNVLKTVAVSLLAGVALPLAFFPEPVRAFALALPFHYLFHTPVSYLLGTASDTTWGGFFRLALSQGLWIGAFTLLSLAMYDRLVRRFFSAGG